MAKLRTLEQAIGGELKRLREAKPLRQDDLAYVAQTYGLGWTQAAVAAIEAGRRSLSPGELGLLPTIVTGAGIWLARFADLIPNTDERLIVAPGVDVPAWVARHGYLSAQEQEQETRRYERPERRPGTTQAQYKAARAEGVTPDALSRAAFDQWGWGLDDERDRRIGDRAKTLSPRSLQAVRGRVTRQLREELKPRITKKRRR